jgi:hypothetical protein
MRIAVASCLACAACLPPPASSFVQTDDTYRPRPSHGFVDLYIDQAPPRRFRVVGTLHAPFASFGEAPLVAAREAKKHGCDLVTTELVGAVAALAPTSRIDIVLASWSSGSSGSGGSIGSSGSWSRSSGGWYSERFGEAYGPSTVPPRPRPRVFYCGIYVDPPTPPAAAPATTEAIRTLWL